MKITVCDPCKKTDNVVTVTERYMKVKGHPELRLDICDKHAKEIQGMSITDYVKYCYKLNGVDLSEKTDAEIKELCL